MNSSEPKIAAIVILLIDRESRAPNLPQLAGTEKVYITKSDDINLLGNLNEVVFVISKYSTISTYFQKMVLEIQTRYRNLIPMYTYFLDDVVIPEGISGLRSLERIGA